MITILKWIYPIMVAIKSYYLITKNTIVNTEHKNVLITHMVECSLTGLKSIRSLKTGIDFLYLSTQDCRSFIQVCLHFKHLPIFT